MLSAANQECQTILVIDDDLPIRDSLRDLLEIEGFRVILAEDGRRGIEAIRDGLRPHLILLDLMMPNMNGWEFLTARQADILLSSIPVVVISAYLERFQGFPVCGRLNKPIDVTQLLRVVKRCAGSLPASVSSTD